MMWDEAFTRNRIKIFRRSVFALSWLQFGSRDDQYRKFYFDAGLPIVTFAEIGLLIAVDVHVA